LILFAQLKVDLPLPRKLEKGKRQLATLKDPITYGIIELEMGFYTKCKGKECTVAVTDRGGCISVRREFRTPSDAARVAVKTRAEGSWFSGSTRNPETRRMSPIAELRAKLTGGLCDSTCQRGLKTLPTKKRSAPQV